MTKTSRLRLRAWADVNYSRLLGQVIKFIILFACRKDMLAVVALLLRDRSLFGPEATEAGSLSSSVGRHFVRVAGKV